MTNNMHFSRNFFMSHGLLRMDVKNKNIPKWHFGLHFVTYHLVLDQKELGDEHALQEIMTFQ
jgi:hypothetical protein